MKKHIEQYHGPIHMNSVFRTNVKKLVKILKYVLQEQKIEILNELAYSHSFCCKKRNVEFNIEVKKMAGTRNKLLCLTF